MAKKSTNELENILGNTSSTRIEEYLKENADRLLMEAHPFSTYMHEMIRKYGKTQQEVFLQADFPEPWRLYGRSPGVREHRCSLW